MLSDIIGIDPDTVRPKSAGGKPECISDDFDDERPSDDGKCNCISDRKGGREGRKEDGRKGRKERGNELVPLRTFFKFLIPMRY